MAMNKKRVASKQKKKSAPKTPAPVKTKTASNKTARANKPESVTSRHFGPIGTDYADAELMRAGEAIRIDVNVENPAKLEQADVDTVDRIVDDIDRHDATARAAFAAQMNDETSQVPKFWQFHHDEVEEHAGLEREAFVSALKLVRAGFYPDGAFGSKSYFVVDYALRGPNTDQLLVAKFGRDGSVLTISWES
jgi:hypothetical protein